ncbi:hypothetical protein MIND_00125600 [Mycena indigotica]|uniref:F-box domain-containing protein n=1 Tax=Mycena indigotica TaxID=2126181 RepID=A0A8H6TG64_9AGAR|nr:uncharacterized protein MIND_00125600 [Mycena indigotica]KAF7316076.1 hypothetical protein MIND_00125600 [Mycena indigotica]
MSTLHSRQHLSTHLPVDIFYDILGHCDLASVLALSSTCRRLYEVAQHTTVWRAIVRRLQEQWILESDIPNLSELSSVELISIVKRAVIGPETWTRSTPEVRAAITIPATIRQGPGVLHWDDDTRLVPNGRYVLFLNEGHLQCFSIAEKRHIWTYVSEIPTTDHCSVQDFDVCAHPDKAGEWMVLMIGERTFPLHGMFPGRRNFITVIEFEPTTGYGPFNAFSLQGHVGTAEINSDRANFLLDWKRKQFVCVSGMGMFSRIGLITDHVVLKTARKGAEMLYLIPSADIFENYGTRVTTFDRLVSSVCMVDVLVLSATVEHTIVRSHITGDSDLVIHKSPLRDNTWRVWVYCAIPQSYGFPERRILRCYQITIHEGRPLLSQRSSLVPNLLRGPRGLSYSGHASVYYSPSRELIVPPPKPPSDQGAHALTSTIVTRAWRALKKPGYRSDSRLLDAAVVTLDGCDADHVHISAYAGALCYPTTTDIRILYYR